MPFAYKKSCAIRMVRGYDRRSHYASIMMNARVMPEREKETYSYHNVSIYFLIRRFHPDAQLTAFTSCSNKNVCVCVCGELVRYTVCVQ